MYYLIGALLITIGALMLALVRAHRAPSGAHRGTRQAIIGQEIQWAARVEAYQHEARRAFLIMHGTRADWELS